MSLYAPLGLELSRSGVLSVSDIISLSFKNNKKKIILCSQEYWSSQGSPRQKHQAMAVSVAEVTAVTYCLPACLLEV